MPSSCRRPWLARGAALLSLCATVQAIDNLGYLEQTFYFDYNVASQAVPVPVTNPVAPYYLQIYTSAFVFPFIVSAGSGLSFDWEVPFGPGTLYQICMFDKNGNTGGCEGIYTMIANTTATPSCSNATFPLGPLDVDAVTDDGTFLNMAGLTRFRNPCTDIQVTPKNGTPPYIFTVAPALHPPHNQTGTAQSPMNWTVNLGPQRPVFLGPERMPESNKISPATAVGSGIVGLLIGLVAGAVGVYVFYRQRWRRARHTPLDPTGFEGYMDPYNFRSPTAPAHYKALPTQPQDTSLSAHSLSPSYVAMQRLQGESGHYQIEPFTPAERRNSSYGSEFNGEPHAPSPTSGNGGNIYVVHHDAGRAPVTVYHQEGAEVVELPPQYIRGSSTNDLADPPEITVTTEDRTASVSDIISPPRRPNRPRKP
ncbi:hypothetical protein K438DRAFT_1804061 [Mycena galopus ATCC 62051]|nr:hypothetical protein K438DRAFT_1804061 [Mycena galopus ATCC 62051]